MGFIAGLLFAQLAGRNACCARRKTVLDRLL